MSADPRAVLVWWALPLLARARRYADDIVERGCAAVDLRTTELLADDIAALIGHGVTDQPPADELAELTRDEPPIHPPVPGEFRRGTRGYFLARCELAKSSEPATRAMACDGCGDRLPSTAVCVAPDGRHTPRPLPEIDAEAHRYGVEDPVQELAGHIEQAVATLGAGDCDVKMVHYFGPPTAPVAGMFDSAGHPPNCPAYTPPADAKAVHAAGSANRLMLAPGLTLGTAKWSEPAAPVETTDARLRRLDRERDEAGSEYRRRIQVADAAWREVGGR